MQSNRNNLLLIGLAGIIITAIGQAISLGAPTLDEGGAKTQAWLADNRNLAITSFYMVGLGLTLTLALIIPIRQRLLNAEGGSGLLANTFALAGVLALAVVGAGIGAFGGMIYTAETLSADSAQLLNSVVYITIAAAAFPTAVALAAASVVIIRTRTLNVALGYLGLLAALLHLASAAAFDTGSGLASPQTAGLVAAISFYIFMIGGAVLLLRTREEESTVVGLAAAAVMTEMGVLAAGAIVTETSGATSTARQSN